MSYAANSLAIDHVIESGGDDEREICARTLIGGDYAALRRLRLKIEDAAAAGSPSYLCPVCRAPLYLRCADRHKDDQLSRNFHFWHGKVPTRCPLSQESRLSREAILAAKYHGQREGAAHIRIKELVYQSLCDDPRFTDVAKERTWRLEGDPQQWRRPDVSALYLGQPVVFEIQLSTTFVSVMAQRRHFYRERGALLVWVVAQFDRKWANCCQEDIFYPNNRNIFVINASTAAASHEAQALMLEAHWLQPHYRQGGKKFSDQSALVDFGTLTMDLSGQRIYHVDVDEAEARVEATIAQAPLRGAFHAYWKRHLAGAATLAEARAMTQDWNRLRQRFEREHGLQLPEYRGQFADLLNSVYSARLGRLVGWGYRDLVQLAHHLYAKHKGLLWPYMLALSAYRRNEHVRQHDTTGRWLNEKAPLLREAFLAGDQQYRLNQDDSALLAFLFPEMTPLLGLPVHQVIEADPGCWPEWVDSSPI